MFSSFNPNKNTRRLVLLLSSAFRHGNCGPEKSENISKVIVISPICEKSVPKPGQSVSEVSFVTTVGGSFAH